MQEFKYNLFDLGPSLDWAFHGVEWSNFFSPVYLLSALLISVLWLRLSYRVSWNAIIKIIFAKKIWITHSTLVDAGFSLVNLFVFGSTFIWTENFFFQSTLKLKTHVFDVQWPSALESSLATLVTMLSIDLASYVVHRGLHASALLWKIHKVHHSAKFLTPLTTYRQHPLEPLLLNSARGCAAGVGLVLLRLIFPNSAPVITIGGLGAGFFVYMFTIHLHHWMVPIHYPGWLRRVFVSPHVHHLHHSSNPEHYNSNYGVVFSIWDRLFKTYRDQNVGFDELNFGISPDTSGLPTAAIPGRL